MGSLAQNSFGAIRCSCNPRFRRRFRTVPVQMAAEVPDGSGVDSRQGSGWFRMVPVQIADAVPAGFGTDG